jgi:ankyrin repeat protein
MSDENARTSLGKWSIAFALIPLAVVFVFVLLFMVSARLQHVSGEAGLGVLLAIGAVIYFGSHVVVITSLMGIGLAIIAIYTTSWRQGLVGFLLNMTTLIIAGSYLLSIYHKAAIDPDRLPIAAHQGDYKTVEKLLAKGFDINRRCGSDTALSNAAVRGSEQIVRLLLSHGADVNISSPLSKAAQFGDGNEKIAKMLLDHGADPNCLHSATVGRHKNIVRLLLEYNANVNQKDGNRRTPLHKAVIFGDEDMIRLLINKGADVNAKNNEGETPLHVLVKSWPQKWWARDFRVKTINILLDNGADIEARARSGKTPLMLVAEAQNSSDAVKELLERGADKNAKDNNGKTALYYAMQVKNTETLNLLLDNDTDANNTNGKINNDI